MLTWLAPTNDRKPQPNQLSRLTRCSSMRWTEEAKARGRNKTAADAGRLNEECVLRRMPLPAYVGLLLRCGSGAVAKQSLRRLQCILG